MNATNDLARRKVAEFEIFFTRYLDPEGKPIADLPAWAQQPEPLRTLYCLMVRTRVFDKKAVSLQRTGQLGTYAACLGQEAIGAAVGHALGADDVFIPAYREYAAQFARGVPMKDILLYWGGDERGMCYPEGTPAYHDFPLSVPIGTHVPHAVGVAYAFRLRGEKRAVLVSCGDGATSKGDVLEAISAAKVWNLPIVFLVNNNQWAISLPREKQTGAQTLAQKAIGGGMAGEQVDGNDVVASREVLLQAIGRARDGGGPSLVEAVTYRLHDHTTADDARRYRSDEEVEAAWANCPIKRTKAYLQSAGHWTDADEAQLQTQAAAEVEEQVQAFLGTEPEPPETIFDSLYETLPKSLAWQRDEVIAAGPIEEHH